MYINRQKFTLWHTPCFPPMPEELSWSRVAWKFSLSVAGRNEWKPGTQRTVKFSFIIRRDNVDDEYQENRKLCVMCVAKTRKYLCFKRKSIRWYCICNSCVLFRVKQLTGNQNMVVQLPEHMAHWKPMQAIRMRGVGGRKSRLQVCQKVRNTFFIQGQTGSTKSEWAWHSGWIRRSLYKAYRMTDWGGAPRRHRLEWICQTSHELNSP